MLCDDEYCWLTHEGTCDINQETTISSSISISTSHYRRSLICRECTCGVSKRCCARSWPFWNGSTGDRCQRPDRRFVHLKDCARGEVYNSYIVSNFFRCWNINEISIKIFNWYFLWLCSVVVSTRDFDFISKTFPRPRFDPGHDLRLLSFLPLLQFYPDSSYGFLTDKGVTTVFKIFHTLYFWCTFVKGHPFYNTTSKRKPSRRWDAFLLPRKIYGKFVWTRSRNFGVSSTQELRINQIAQFYPNFKSTRTFICVLEMKNTPVWPH